MQNFKKLIVWQKGHAMTLEVYKLTAKFPKDEIYGLTSQIRRASASVGLNISEGCGRATDPDFRKFLVYSMGSASEVEYCLILASDLKYISEMEFNNLLSQVTEVKKMLATFIKKL